MFSLGRFGFLDRAVEYIDVWTANVYRFVTYSAGEVNSHLGPFGDWFLVGRTTPPITTQHGSGRAPLAPLA